MKHIASCAFAGSSRNSLKLAANSLMHSVNLHVSTQCPCHFHSPRSAVLRPPQFRHTGSISTPPNTDYAFEMASSAIRFGRGCSAEVGYDLQSMHAKRVIVVTDRTVRDLPACATVLASLQHCHIQYSVFDRVQIEPSDASFQDAIQFARAQLTSGGVDAFVAVGGGSVIDTAKAANLYTCFSDNHFLDFVNAPVGKGLPVPGPLKPLIAIPTTAGTGSETTGVAIFDMPSLKAKTGISSKALKPTLGLVDADNTKTMPFGVSVASGFDVLCHALEAYTCVPYNQRTPRPPTPAARPAYQGANPISDVWSLTSLRSISKYFVRACRDADDDEAREAMLMAATMAGIGFGSAGVHLCHGMSYAISGLNKSPHVQYQHADYTHLNRALVPHGISVSLSAPAVFQLTAHADPRRHAQALAALSAPGSEHARADTSTAAKYGDGDYVGRALSARLMELMQQLEVPMGLGAIGFVNDDIDALVESTLPQQRVNKMAYLGPTKHADAAILAELFRSSMTY